MQQNVTWACLFAECLEIQNADEHFELADLKSSDKHVRVFDVLYNTWAATLNCQHAVNRRINWYPDLFAGQTYLTGLVCSHNQA